MTLNQFVNENYTKLKEASQNITDNNELSDELLHHCLEIMMTKSNVDSILSSGGAYFYIIRIMLNNWKSTSSPFYKKWRAPSQHTNFLYLDIEDTSELYEDMILALNELDWYSRELFLTLVNENHTISSLSKATGIPRTSVSVTINAVRKHLKNKIK